jgi:hypothetical protein
LRAANPQIGIKMKLKYFQEYCAIDADGQMPSFRDVKNKIFFELVNQHKNRHLLTQIPHATFNDLAITFYYFASNVYGWQEIKQKVIITHSHCQKWATDPVKLFARAVKNTPREHRVIIEDIEDIIKNRVVSDLRRTLNVTDRQLLRQRVEKAFSSGEFERINQYIRNDDRSKMYVLTNAQKQYGAATVLYPRVLKSLADRLNINFFLLPGSIHEFMLVPDDHQKSVADMYEIVRESNNTAVAVDEILSYSVYYYDRSTEEISIVSR